MGSLQIDLDLIQRIDRRMKIRTAAMVTVLIALIVELAFIMYFLIFMTVSISLNFIPLPLFIFSTILFFVLYYVIFQLIDLQEAGESRFDGIKKRTFKQMKKRSRNFLAVFIVLLVISILLIVPFNQENVIDRSLHQGDVAYFSSSYYFGTRTIKSIAFEGNGNVLIYQNGSAVPVYNIIVTGNLVLNQSLPPGYYSIIVQSGDINVNIYEESVYTSALLPLIGSIAGLLIIFYINITISNKNRSISYT